MRISILKLAFFFALLPLLLKGQEELFLDGGCQFDIGTESEEIFGYGASKEAVDIVSRVTNAMKIQQRFILKSANVANAKASSSGGQRYILYNTTFLEKFKEKSGTNWAAFCVLAHEIGHHHNNDNFLESEIRRRKIAELSADRFAGYALQKMGASLEEAQAGIQTFSLDAESSTHPPKSARLEAVASGWKQAKENTPYKTDLIPDSTNNQSAKDWYDRGVALYDKAQFEEAIKCFDNAIRLKPDFAAAYLRRGDAKDELTQFRPALEDLNIVLRLKPDNALAYSLRGIIYSNLEKYEQAILDLNEAVRLSPQFDAAFNNRGVAKYNLKDYNGAMSDYNEAIRLEPGNYQSRNNKGNVFKDMGRLEDAIVAYSEAIQVKPDYAMAYYNRGNTYLSIQDYDQAIDDYNEAIKHKPEFKEAFNNRGNARQRQGRYEEAIEDYNQAIKLSKSDCDAIYFSNRGNALYNLQRYEEAIRDYDWAINCDPSNATAFGNQGCAILRLEDRSRYEEALNLIKTALELDPDLTDSKDCMNELLRLLDRK